MSSTFDSNTNSPIPPAVRYRALNPLAVTSAVLGALSIVTALYWALAVVPIAGIIFGWLAWKQIRKAPDESTGLTLTLVGIILSAAFWAGGYILLGYDYFYRQVPPGYQRITYDDLQPDPATPTEPIPQKALDMQDRKVYIQGYMQSRRTLTGIKEFILCPTNGECPFCIPKPKRTEMVRVVLQGDLETIYMTHPVAVAGRFQVDPNDPSGIPYGLEADYLR